jgi:hypothetical protein
VSENIKMLICPTIAYLKTLDNFLPEINESLANKILTDPYSFYAERNILTDDKCFICLRSASYTFRDMTKQKDYWCCGYCAVYLAHKIYDINDQDMSDHMEKIVSRLKI